MDWIMANIGWIVSALWLLSEALAEIPGIKSNSVFQAIKESLQWLKDKFGKKE